MTKTRSRVSIFPILLFAIMTALALFASEALYGFLRGNQLVTTFYLFALPAYALLGLALGASAIIAAIIFRSHFFPLRAFKFDILLEFKLVAFAMPFIQGAVLINVISEIPLYNLSSLLFDLLWIILFFILLIMSTKFTVQKSESSYKLLLLIGVILSSFCIATIYSFFEPSIATDYLDIFGKILATFLYICLSLMIPIIVFLFAARFTAISPRYGLALPTTIAAAVAVALVSASPRDHQLKARFQLPSIAAAGPNVIMIVVDTLRADHLSCYGYDHKTSPVLDQFCSTAMRFENCYSTSNWTLPGHASIFTGRYPISHGVHKPSRGTGLRTSDCFPLGEEETTVAEILSSAGYQTAAVVANFGYVSPVYGLDQGFQYWYDTPPKRYFPISISILKNLSGVLASRFVTEPPYRRASEINNVVIEWIQNHHTDPFFLFINYMDPHAPYVPPRPWDEKFQGKLAGFVLDVNGVRDGRRRYSQEDWQHLQSQYDGEIAYFDSQLKVLLDGLREYDVYENSVIILTSDHGEFLGEHGLLDHQVALYDPVIRVPLIIKPVVGESFRHEFPEEVQIVDILPTILNFLGISIPASVQGRSLMSSSSQPIIAQHYPDRRMQSWFGGKFRSEQIAFIRMGFKYTISIDGEEEFFDLNMDDAELQNLVTANPRLLSIFRSSLADWLRKIEVKEPREIAGPELDAETRRRLKLLGYIR